MTTRLAAREPRNTVVHLIALVLMLAGTLGSVTTAGASDGSVASPAPGTLTGRVLLRPFCPVAADNVPCPVPSGAYASREILVTRGGEVVARGALDAHGRFRILLAPGRYTVDINRVGVDASDDVPKEVHIRTGETQQVDVAIDTGIR